MEHARTLAVAPLVKWRHLSRMRAVALPVALYLAGAFVFFRSQILSKFDLVFGDRGDARLIAFLHEHVYQWLSFRSTLLSPPFFYDVPQTLGYSEAFLLNQVVYAPLRLLGADPYLALSLVIVALSVASFACGYLFLRRLGVSRAIAALGALVMTFPNNLYIKSRHLQHFAVYYLPVVAWCVAVAAMEIHTRPRRACLFGGVAGLVLGMVFSTGYYMAWFFGLGLVVLTIVAAGLVWPALRDWWRQGGWRVAQLLFWTVLGFGAAIAVFLEIYAPALASGATRTLGDYLLFAPHPEELFNVGNWNLIWSRPIAAIGIVSAEQRAFGETSLAITPILQLLLLVAGGFALRRRCWPQTAQGRVARALALGGLIVCVLFYVFIIKVNEQTLFVWLQAYVPGAMAIRVGYRAMIVGNLFAVIAVAVAFDRIVRRALANPRPSRRIVQVSVVSLLLAMVAIEQINAGPATFMSRAYERQHLARLGRAPSTCQTFFVAAQPDRQPYEVQIDAMMIALQQRLPTINGYSGFWPPGWELGDPKADNYERLAMKWARAHDLQDGLCRADVLTGAWTSMHQTLTEVCEGACPRMAFDPSHDFHLALGAGGNGDAFADGNWSDPEAWGRWTGARKASLLMSIDAPRDLAFTITMRALLSEEAPTQSVWLTANDCQLGRLDYTLAGGITRTLSGRIPGHCFDEDRNLELDIRTNRAARPSEIGINEDFRLLGIGVESLVFHQADAALSPVGQ